MRGGGSPGQGTLWRKPVRTAGRRWSSSPAPRQSSSAPVPIAAMPSPSSKGPPRRRRARAPRERPPLPTRPAARTGPRAGRAARRCSSESGMTAGSRASAPDAMRPRTTSPNPLAPPRASASSGPAGSRSGGVASRRPAPARAGSAGGRSHSPRIRTGRSKGSVRLAAIASRCRPGATMVAPQEAAAVPGSTGEAARATGASHRTIDGVPREVEGAAGSPVARAPRALPAERKARRTVAAADLGPMRTTTRARRTTEPFRSRAPSTKGSGWLAGPSTGRSSGRGFGRPPE